MPKPRIRHMVLLCSLLLAGIGHAAPTTVQQCRQAGVTEYSDRPGRCAEPRQVVVDPAATHGLDGGAPISSPGRRTAIRKNTHTEAPAESARSGQVRRPARIDQAGRCRDLEHQLHQIDELAARPGSGSRQDRLRLRRMRVRSLQAQQSC
ncbi:MAG: hypothetical protein AB9M60_21440 [Leptothrix sp. (in: b-proteobacteria)]